LLQDRKHFIFQLSSTHSSAHSTIFRMKYLLLQDRERFIIRLGVSNLGGLSGSIRQPS
jgi:hypothetical protein